MPFVKSHCSHSHLDNIMNVSIEDNIAMTNIKYYYGGYSLQCKPSLFSSDISEISYNDCHNVIETYGIFVWNFSNRFQNFMLG